MKKAYLPPLLVLGAILAFCLWNGAAMKTETARWQSQLQQVDALAQAGNWASAVEVLTDSYQDWAARQTYLHVVSAHDAVDDAEAMYRRAMAFAAAREPSEFRAEVSDLRDQLRLLAEMERFSVRNVL
ncbi:DUF4363 family protein [uncultured Oscillibacter sp.]|uniref:DUF4363 family protein n=1 Tax=uncultured Oscillibacter sp. TaxID=876091 RepID=UPI0025CE5B00|nr:DUF4363 family protein [uncultured Oscillibacter sp.]